MGKIQEFEEDQEERKKVNTPDLKIIRGGLDGGFPPTGNWLMDLAEGTIFSVVSKNDKANFMALTLEVYRKNRKTIRLWDNLRGQLFGDVFPVRFTNTFELIEVLETPEEQEGQPDGDGDRV